MKKILVAGGGITGLTAAFYLRKRFSGEEMPAEITLVEQNGQLGGKIRTSKRDGFVIERGPDSFLARKTPIIDLTRELGLEGELAGLHPQGYKTYILHRGKLHPMPAGLMLGIPTRWQPFLKTGLVSPLGKARAAMDLFLPRRKEQGDEALGDFLERRLGKEVLEHIAEPLLAGIYAGDTHALSLQATFPQFALAEQKYGSLIRGMIAGMNRSSSAGGGPAAGPREESGIPESLRYSQFLTYKRGLATLVDALIQAMPDVRFRTGCRMLQLAGTGSRYEVTFAGGLQESYDGVILAVPNYAAAELLPSLPALRELGAIPYISVANVVLAFRKEDLQHELGGSGFLVPRTEGRFITACTWTSRKWPHTAPDGRVLLRCYIGRSGEQAWQQLSDEQLVENVKRELKEIVGIGANPLFCEVTRLPRSMPQYPVGHLERVRRAREELAGAMPGVVIAGAGLQGVGLPDCIRQGKEAADALFRHLTAVSAD